LIALAGSFHAEGSIDQILGRLGAVSAFRNILYWSTTDKKWRPIANNASALSGPNKNKTRSDFLSSDLVKNVDLYYWEDDSRSGEVIYRLKVLERTPNRAVIVSENISPIKKFFVTLFPPRALQSTIFIERLSAEAVGIYILGQNGEGTSGLAQGHDDSFVNRATALYWYLAGLKPAKASP